MIETSSEGGKITQKWWRNVLTPQTVLWILAGFVSIVLFWKDSKDNWDKVTRLENRIDALQKSKADAETVKDLDDKVTRQYSVQRDQNILQDKQIEECLDWISWKKGYEQAEQDLKRK